MSIAACVSEAVNAMRLSDSRSVRCEESAERF